MLGGISNAVVMVVLPWLILERTGSAAAAGLVGALSALPGIVVSPVVGRARRPRSAARRCRSLSDLLSAAVGAAVPGARRGRLARLRRDHRPRGPGRGLRPCRVHRAQGADPAGRGDQPESAGTRSTVCTRGCSWAAGWSGPMVGAIGIATVGSVADDVVRLRGVRAGSTCGAGDARRRTAPSSPATELVDASPWHSARAGLGALLRDRPVLAPHAGDRGHLAALRADRVGAAAGALPGASSSRRPSGSCSARSRSAAMVGAFGYGWIARRTTRHRLAIACMLLAADHLRAAGAAALAVGDGGARAAPRARLGADGAAAQHRRAGPVPRAPARPGLRRAAQHPLLPRPRSGS